MAGTFILSLDCEGKWGVADHLNSGIHAALNDGALRDTYAAIFGLLTKYDIAATFAVVDFFTRTTHELNLLGRSGIDVLLPYTTDAWSDLAHGTGQGWAAPWLLDMIGDRHEIASHGASHTPFGTLAGEALELELCEIGADKYSTIIYPRNDIAHSERLAELGIVGYRERRHGNRLTRLVDEVNLFQSAEGIPAPSNPVVIPPGFFINWLSGVRMLFPPALTRLRARRIIENAIATGGVAHFWTHPENIVTSPQTMANLAAICEEAARGRKRGLNIVTQREFCAIELGRGQ